MVTLDGIELQLGPNGYTARELTFIDINKFWLSASFRASTRGSDDTICKEITLFNGKKLAYTYNNATCAASLINLTENVITEKYAYLLQISHTVAGTGLSLASANNFYAKSKQHQTRWATFNKKYEMLQDPELSLTDKDRLIASIESNEVQATPILLSISNTASQVYFAENNSFETSLWPTGNFCDFKFTLVEFKPYTSGNL